MKFLSIRTLLKSAAGLLLITLSACSNIPSSVIISPDFIAEQSNVYHNKTAKLKVVDRRNNIHVLQIVNDQKATALIHSKTPIETTLLEQLSKRYQNASLNISDLSPKNDVPMSITVYVDTALINVEQDIVDYRSQNTIKVTVMLMKGNVKLTKSFQQKSGNNGPMQADFAVLERDFSQQLGKLMQNILFDRELVKFITS